MPEASTAPVAPEPCRWCGGTAGAAGTDCICTVCDLQKQLLRVTGALMSMVNQFFTTGKDGRISHSFMSAEEEAIGVLLDLGLAEEAPPGKVFCRLRWDKLGQEDA